MKELDRLLEVADILLGPDGCPWDREQTFFTLQPYILEEAHELLEAIDNGESSKIVEEAGDLLYTVIFLAKLGEKEGNFVFSDILNVTAEKLIRRHPHVFSDAKVANVEELSVVWEKIKKSEKGHDERKSALDGIPPNLPLLAKAQKMFHKMKKQKHFFNFSEAKESSTAISEEKMGEEFLKWLSQVDQAGLNAESILRRTLSHYEKKFREQEKKLPEMNL